MLTRLLLCLSLLVMGLPAASAQTISADKATIGGTRTSPDSDTSTRVQGLPTTTSGTIPVLDGEGDMRLLSGLSFTGSNPTFTGSRFYADFSNATVGNRLIFQSSTTNGATSVYGMPNGSGGSASVGVFGLSDPNNSPLVALVATPTESSLRANITGSATQPPLTLYTVGTERMRIGTDGYVGIGTTGLAPLHVNSNANAGAAGAASILLTGDGNKERIEIRGGNGGGFQGRAATGTYSSPTSTASGALLAWLGGGGYVTGTGWAGNSAYAGFTAAENFTGSAQGTDFTIHLTPAGSITRSEKLKVQSAGHVLPGLSSTQNIGAPTNMWSTVYAREIRALTLVAQDVISTIGGWIYVGATTKLLADVTSGAGRIVVEHNEAAVGDRLYLNARLQAEIMVVTAGPVACSISPAACGGISTGYYYDVTRGDASTGADAWLNGEAVLNTGVIGDCFIEQYAFTSLGSGTAVGPSVVGNCRTANSGYSWGPRWAIGQLNGLYGVSTSTFGAAFGDPSGANSLITSSAWKLRQGTTDKITLDGGTGNISLTGNMILSTGGSITSTGNYALDGNGLTFERGSGASSFTTGRYVRFGTSGGGYSDLRIGTYSDGTAIIEPGGTLWIGDAGTGQFSARNSTIYIRSDGPSSSAPDIASAWLKVDGDGVWFGFNDSGSSRLVEHVRPEGNGTMTLGSTSNRWANIHLALPNDTGNAFSYVVVGNSADNTRLAYVAGPTQTYTVGTCTMTFRVGVLTGSTCPP